MTMPPTGQRLIRDAGYDPTVILYLETGWTRAQLLALFAAANETPRSALRIKRSPAEEMGLLDPAVSQTDLLDAMIAHPILVNRPFVACRTGVKLCRPSGRVLDLLERWPAGPWHKEAGDLLIDEAGQRMTEE